MSASVLELERYSDISGSQLILRAAGGQLWKGRAGIRQFWRLELEKDCSILEGKVS